MVTDPWGLGFGDTLPSIRFMVLLLIGSLGIVPVAAGIWLVTRPGARRPGARAR